MNNDSLFRTPVLGGYVLSSVKGSSLITVNKHMYITLILHTFIIDGDKLVPKHVPGFNL